VPQLVAVGHALVAGGPVVDTTAWHLGGVAVRKVDRIVFGTAVTLMVGLQLLIYRTKFGTAMRAVSFNAKAAALMGINVDRVVSGTFVLGSALAGAAGYLYAVKYQQQTLSPTASAVWVLLGMKAFVAAVVGGIGNVRGAMLGGLLIGLVENFGIGAGNLMHQAGWTTTVFETSGYRDVYVFALLILVLLVRPSGLLGRATVEKV
jgi:branched-chain amino acid transport system permease protein